MDMATALDWLRGHQRIPLNSPQDVIDSLKEVRKVLAQHPDPRCLPLVFGMFDDHMGWGIFQLFDDVLAKYNQEQLTPHLKRALLSDNRGTRWWATHWAREFLAPELAPELEAILLNPEDDDAHYFAIGALADIYQMTHDSHVLAVLRDRAATETDPECRELLRESFKEFEAQG